MGYRLVTLDAMRGIAAIVVVYYHSAVITDAACIGPRCNVPLGFLAVDLFFALSGYVLSCSYDRKFADGLSPWAFVRQRLVRLMPIYWLGLLIALPVAALQVAKGVESVDTLIGTAIVNAAILPFPVPGADHTVIALLRTGWSLFFELWVANLAFALFWRQLRGAGLAAVIGASFVALAVGVVHHGDLDIGPVWHTFAGGFPRVMFSFFLGVALRRGAGRLPILRVPSVIVVGTMLASFFVPVATAWEAWFDLACVALVYPLLIHAGATATISRPRMALLLGNASYPLYLIHMPLLDMLEEAMRKVGLPPSQAAATLFVVVAVALAAAIEAIYDRPARQALRRLLEPSRGDRVPGVLATLPVEEPAPGWSLQPSAAGHGNRG